MFGGDITQQKWPEAVGPYGPYGGFGPTIMAIAWAEFALATLLIILRIATRYFIQPHAGWALTWTGVSWIVGFISQVVFTTAVYRSLDGFSDAWTVPTALQYTWVAIDLTFIAIGIGKFAVIAFILTIQGTTHYRQRYFLYFLAASNILLDVVFVLYIAFRCTPVNDQFVLGADMHCASTFVEARSFGYFVGSWNAATDLILALYPLYLFWNIQIAPHVKWGICSVMALGFIACAMACTKTWDLMYVTNTQRLNYELYCILTWSYTEVWVVIITCSIPPLWPLAKRVVIGSRSSYNVAKGWVDSSQPGSGGSRSRSNKRNTMNLLTSGQSGTTSSAKGLGARGRADSVEKDIGLLKHPQANPRSVSRAPVEAGGQRHTRRESDGKEATNHRDRSTASKTPGKVFVDTESMSDGPEAYEVYEPERGIMMARDLARPGIVITKEYTVETERKREDRRGSERGPDGFGTGKPMRHNWGDPDSV